MGQHSLNAVGQDKYISTGNGTYNSYISQLSQNNHCCYCGIAADQTSSCIPVQHSNRGLGEYNRSSFTDFRF